MAEIKNTFIKAKMNKDLDDRLVPTGEYRNAQNVSISRSEGSDVGALENILGNSIIEQTNLGIPNLDVIGFLADNNSDNIYVFLTDYIDTSVSGISDFAPISSNCIIGRYNVTNNSFIKLVEGRFLNFAKNNPIIGVNILEDLLFWTDNRNQPRKINVSDAAQIPNYYTSEETISVAKPAPLHPIYLSNIAQGLPLESTMKNPSQEFLPDGSINPDYELTWAGDPNLLKDKFVRFSYRYKFDDGEYSLMAPFTQSCFIPKQQGYFIDNDQDEAYRSTVVQFVENNVTQIGLNILLESQNIESDLHVTELEILYKESDSNAIKVIESIPINSVISKMSSNVNKNVYNFPYISTKPYRTLPQDQTTRVYDQVPVRALAQEVISNRIVYGNFYNKMSPPNTIKYGLGYSNKEYDLSSLVPQSQSEYPNHTIKQNRNYQAGIILSDKFGRQSSVILSSKDTSNKDLQNIQYGGSTIYVPYYNGAPNTILDWPGWALRVRFEKVIPENLDIPGYPGLYSEENPLGWYSYKIVIKQQEQDYYNVYLPSILNGYPTGTVDQNDIANIVLINDNINKVPRDLSEVGPDQRQYRSSVQLFGRVNPTAALNNQYYPGTNSDTVVSISTVADTNYNVSQGANLVYSEFYQSETNPLIGRINTSKAIGVTNSNFNLTLGVYETNPVVSLLDIFWETSSVGLISELNAAIEENFNGPVTLNLNGVYSQNEGMVSGTKIISGAFAEDGEGHEIITPVNFTFLSVIDGNGVNVKNRFTINQTLNTSNKFDISTNDLFYYGSNSSTDIGSRNFTFTINCEDIDAVTTVPIKFNGSVENIVPSITNCPTSVILIGENRFDPWIVYTMIGTNGFAGTNKTQGLVWSISNVTFNGDVIQDQDLFEINSNGVITNPNGTAQQGNYQITVNLVDAAGVQATPCVLGVRVGEPQVTIRRFTLEATILESWELEWDDITQTQVLGNPLCDQVCQNNISAGIPSSNEITATVNNVNGSLQGTATYLFKVNGAIVYQETLSNSDPYISVTYTFQNVQTEDILELDLTYGIIAQEEYYLMSKCQHPQAPAPGFTSLNTVSSFNDSLTVPGARVYTPGLDYTFIITGKTTNPGNIGIVDTGEQNCPEQINYYILQPACASSSQLTKVYTTETLTQGDKVSVYGQCMEYYDIDVNEEGTIDITGFLTCSCP